MARKSNEEPIVLGQEAEQENPVDPTTETPVEEAPKDETPKEKKGGKKENPKETPIEQQVSVKPVKVHTLEEVDCWIGGNHYQLRKDHDHSVPSDVAAVLVNARKVYRI